ncbi:5097_t:CDS:2 [Paraglomus brasilianum]|uniref:Small ribosomal subunit protein mS41 n=1 Tax=Paraglomus brasilianum TaxID=144538 RepID=A0A9N8VNZ6_9GLOM|nr:5097_t:CDS:2 [Paraglomus brasilianum]
MLQFRTLRFFSITHNYIPIRRYSDLPLIANRKEVPPPRGNISTPKDFLERIGRGCVGLADKFQDWEHLFTATSLEMKSKMGLAAKERKWILRWREHYRKGIDP